MVFYTVSMEPASEGSRLYIKAWNHERGLITSPDWRMAAIFDMNSDEAMGRASTFGALMRLLESDRLIAFDCITTEV